MQIHHAAHQLDGGLELPDRLGLGERRLKRRPGEDDARRNRHATYELLAG